MSFWERAEKIDRRWIYLAVGVAVILPFLFPTPLPIGITPEARSLYEAVEAIPDGSNVGAEPGPGDDQIRQPHYSQRKGCR